MITENDMAEIIMKMDVSQDSFRNSMDSIKMEMKYGITSSYTDENGEMVQMLSAFVDENGRPVERTKYSHPYSYDMYVMWRGLPNEGANNSIYSDRLLQWDWDKHNSLCRKHFGDEAQIWSDRDPEKIEAFLRDWCNDPLLKLHYIMQGCNVSNGFPVWCFVFHSTVLEDASKKEVSREVAKLMAKDVLKKVGSK